MTAIADPMLHVLARLLLRACSPRRAYAILSRVGACLPAHRDRASVLRAEESVRGRGTCLSRALVLSSRAPAADLVIGVARRDGDKFFAHAWLEFEGESLGRSDVVLSEIARLARSNARRPLV